MKPKSIDELLQETVFSSEEALWLIEVIAKSEDVNDSERNDLQTAKELLESGRDLVLVVLRSKAKRGKP